ncbi:MAG: undecaprenyl-diphosphate phosphatase [Tissierellia bacterium]|nr:undecaprenyl-diphosphate phosphatase [Tissierellia bacterium]
MDFFRVIILGIIEGITEFLPISSTGHLILADEFVKLSPESFANAFMVIIQLGAILSVVVISFNKLNPFSKRYLDDRLGERYENFNIQSKIFYLVKYRNPEIINLWKKIIVGLLPAMVLGLLFDDIIDKYLFNSKTVATTLIFWGIIIILIEKKNKDKLPRIDNFHDMNYKTALLIGFFQCLALIPGTSRSAATIIGALVLGCSRIVATEFSFFLAIPTMLGATFLKVVKNYGGYSLTQWLLILLGSIVSFIVAYITVKKLLDFIKKRDFTIFGYYRIVLGIIVFLMIFLR